MTIVSNVGYVLTLAHTAFSKKIVKSLLSNILRNVLINVEVARLYVLPKQFSIFVVQVETRQHTVVVVGVEEKYINLSQLI